MSSTFGQGLGSAVSSQQSNDKDIENVPNKPNDIPNEVLNIIFSDCDAQTLKSARCAKRQYNHVASRILFREIHIPGLARRLANIAQHPVLRHYPQKIWLTTDSWYEGAFDAFLAETLNVDALRRILNLRFVEWDSSPPTVFRKGNLALESWVYPCWDGFDECFSGCKYEFLVHIMRLLPNIQKVVSYTAQIVEDCDFLDRNVWKTTATKSQLLNNES
ncbi:hypothetical protein EAF04_009285 [Stromatinia cepivora]|nr:hypothetical protein EAF04_009285 [Stromatinia cepivora]